MKKQKNRDQLTPEESRKAIGENLSFGAAEAYKVLRTNLEFATPGESKSKVIGVTSTLKGEGKSTTAINVAYTMAQSGGRVLLIEADMRLPTLAKRIRVDSKPGLSNLLVGKCTGNDALQRSGLIPNLWVMTSGEIPPNPAELLGSDQMAQTIRAMRDVFDVVIIDLPPVSVVTDAVAISKLLDGFVLVVRQNYCERRALDDTVRQMRLVDAKILGFVMTGADTQKKSYKHYGKDYGYGSYKSAKREEEA